MQERVRVAIKQHMCDLCEGGIEIGEMYYHRRYLPDECDHGEFGESRTHIRCDFYVHHFDRLSPGFEAEDPWDFLKDMNTYMATHPELEQEAMKRAENDRRRFSQDAATARAHKKALAEGAHSSP